VALKIEEVEGIGPAYAQKLIAAGVKTDADMLDMAGSAKGRAELSEKTGIAGSLILKWANHVDLMRISGVGPQYAELLEAAGVDTVKELAQRNAANLAAKRRSQRDIWPARPRGVSESQTGLARQSWIKISY
jgi:predicted flap endonuclease-1-like 5' DNA nuclease